MINIGVDIMGGDFAPLEAIQGIISFVSAYGRANVSFTLIGNQFIASPYLTHLTNYGVTYEIVHTDQVIGMNEHPIKAIKEKPNSSISVGFELLTKGIIDAFVGAGNTGAMLVGAMYSVKPIDGVLRPTIASPIPKQDGNYNFLLDVGANADCKPEHLVQFAEMGSLYSKLVLGLDSPKVGLLNLGEEEGKGNILAQAAYPLLKENKKVDFVGNIEGRDVFSNICDVIVCEGFTGNVMLKMAESFYTIFRDTRRIQDDFLDQFNYELYGGTPLLGVNAPVIIGHGISRDTAFKNMYKTAQTMVETGLIKKLKDNFHH